MLVIGLNMVVATLALLTAGALPPTGIPQASVAVLLILVELMVVTAVAVLFRPSRRRRRQCSLGVWVIGRFLDLMRLWHARRARLRGCRPVHALLPNPEKLTSSTSSSTG
jgi:hypothetical protein